MILFLNISIRMNLWTGNTGRCSHARGCRFSEGTNLLTFKEQNFLISVFTSSQSCHGDLTGRSVTVKVRNSLIELKFAADFINKSWKNFLLKFFHMNSAWVPINRKCACYPGYLDNIMEEANTVLAIDVLSLSWKLNNISWKHPSCRQDV